MRGSKISEGAKESRLKELPKQDFEEHDPAASLLLCFYQGIFSVGEVVMLDSGFCILADLSYLFNYSTRA